MILRLSCTDRWESVSKTAASQTSAVEVPRACAIEQCRSWGRNPTVPTTSPGPLTPRITSAPLGPSCTIFALPDVSRTTRRTGSPSRKIDWRRAKCFSWAAEAISRHSLAGISENKGEGLTRASRRVVSPSLRKPVALAHTAAICSSGWSLSIDHAFLSLSPRVLFLAASGATTAPDAIRPGPTTRNVGDNLETRIT